MSLQLLRNTRVFVTTAKSGFTKDNTQEILVQDDISWGQDTNSTDITVNEAGPRPTRGSKRFNDSLNAAEWSFSTYILPYLEATKSLVLVPDYLLWQGLSSGAALDLAGDTGAHANDGNFMVNFKDNAYHELAMLDVYFLIDGTWSKIEGCQVNQAEVSVDIDDIGRVTWSGNGNRLIPLDAAPFDPIALGMDDALYLQLQSSYIKNKLTILKMKDLDSGKEYNIPITGGSFTMNNNVTYLTPNVMSRVNIPIGSFTGSFEMTGSLTAYLNTNPLGSQELYKDLINTLKVVNRFQIGLVLGGEYNDERPAAILVASQANVNIPSIETDDVIGTSLEFKALPTELDSGDEGYLAFSDHFNKTTVANAIATGDAKKTAVTLSTDLPATKTAATGDDVPFAVVATGGTSPYTYKWYWNNVLIDSSINPSAATATLTNNAVTTASSGGYRVVVSDSAGTSVTSTTCNLTVSP